MHLHRPLLFLVSASLVALSACAGEPSTGPSSQPPPPAPPPAPPPPPPPSNGSIRVTTTTTGEDLDLSAYLATVTGQAQERIELNDDVTMSSIPAGSQTVRLEHVADNCSVEGGASRQVSVTGGSTTDVSFSVSCAALPPAEVDVTGTWSGPIEGTDKRSGATSTGTLIYELEQDGDDVTAAITYDFGGGANDYVGVGRVSGNTLTIFSLGFEFEEGRPSKVTATLDVDGDEMTGSDEEQDDFWEATMTLTRQ